MLGGNSSINSIAQASAAKGAEFDSLAHDRDSSQTADLLKALEGGNKNFEKLAKEMGFDSVQELKDAASNGQVNQEKLAQKVAEISGDPSEQVTRAPQISLDQALQPDRLNKVGGKNLGGWINTAA